MNIRNVLVPVDFSLPAEKAVDCGVALARRFRARLTLVHVLEPPPQWPYPVPLDPPADDSRDREEALQKLWSMLSPEDQDDLDLHVVVRLLEPRLGPRAELLLHVIGERGVRRPQPGNDGKLFERVPGIQDIEIGLDCRSLMRCALTATPLGCFPDLESPCQEAIAIPRVPGHVCPRFQPSASSHVFAGRTSAGQRTDE